MLPPQWEDTKASPWVHEAAYVDVSQTWENTLSRTFKDTENLKGHLDS